MAGKNRKTMEQLKQPPEMLFAVSGAAESLPERWRKWKQTTEIYLEIDMGSKTEKEKCSTFLYIIGSEGREIYNTFKVEDENKDKIKWLFAEFDKYCKPKENITVERYRFNSRNQAPSESFEHFITDLKVLAKKLQIW